jgi:hypothetical protein
MADNESGSKNPILKWLEKFRTITWLLAFLTLAGGALKWSSDIHDVVVKLTSKPLEEVQKEKEKEAAELQRRNQDLRFNAMATGYAVAWLASGDAYFAQAVAKGAQVAKADFDQGNSEARRDLTARLGQLHVPTAFAELDFAEPQFGQTSDATVALASAIREKNGEEAKKYFLFEYYVYRLLLEFLSAGNLNVKELRQSILFLRMNENVPAGIEPFQPSSGTGREFCNYWVANAPIGISAPALGKRDELLLQCQMQGRKR